MTQSELQLLWQRVERVARMVALLKRLDRCQTFLQVNEVENLIRNELNQNTETNKESTNA